MSEVFTPDNVSYQQAERDAADDNAGSSPSALSTVNIPAPSSVGPDTGPGALPVQPGFSDPSPASKSIEAQPSAMDVYLKGSKESQSEIDKLMAMLQQRVDNGEKTPWFSMAAALLNPGRTGSFGEALGGAAKVAGDWQQRNQNQQIPLAQAKLQLLQAKNQMAQNQFLMQQANSQSGNGQAATGNVGADNMPVWDDKLYQQRLAMGGVGAQLAKAQLDSYNSQMKAFAEQSARIKSIAAQTQASTSQAQATGKGAVLPTMVPPGVPPINVQQPQSQPSQPAQPLTPAPTGQQGAPMPLTGPAMPSQNDMAAIQKFEAANPTPGGNPVINFKPSANTTGNPFYHSSQQQFPAGASQPSAPVATAAPVQQSGAGLPPMLAAETAKDVATDVNKQYLDQTKSITAVNPIDIADNSRQIKQLIAIGDQHPEIFNALRGQGVFPALLQAAQTGIKAGPLKVSLPVEEAMQKYGLTQEQQNKAEEAKSILSNLVIGDATKFKGAWGAKVSNLEATIDKQASLNSSQPWPVIRQGLENRLVANDTHINLHNDLTDWYSNHQGVSPVEYLRSPTYKQITSQHNALMDKLLEQRTK